MKLTKIILIILFLTRSAYANETTTAITVSLNAPNPGYSIQIQSIYYNDKTVYVHAHIFHPNPEMEYPSVIELIEDTILIKKNLNDFRIYITGKNWNWADENDYIFIDDKKEFELITKQMTKIEPITN